MSRAIWSETAGADIFSIIDYYERIDFALANAMLERIKTAPAPLLDNLFMGSELVPGGVRKWSVRDTPFVLIYETTGSDIHILRVRHNRQNWAAES